MITLSERIFVTAIDWKAMSYTHPEFEGGRLLPVLKAIHTQSILVAFGFSAILMVCLRVLRGILYSEAEPLLGLIDLFTFAFSFVITSILMRILANALDEYLTQVQSEFTRGALMTQKFNEVSILGLVKITEARDSSIANHNKRMGELSYIIAKQLINHGDYKKYISEEYCQDLKVAAPLHDIGKVGLSDKVLHKETDLSGDEFELMKMHVIIGGDFISELQKSLPYRTYYTLAKDIAYHHHQRFDGKGYPNVLQSDKGESYFIQAGVGSPLEGNKIPLSARIVAVADTYDSMVSDRTYKEPKTHEEAYQAILAERGLQFDPDIVDAFLVIHRDLQMIVQGVRA